MSLLNFEEERRSPRPRLLAGILAVAAFFAVGALSNTLAADISINLGATVEFGQGVATTTACDNEITLTPFSKFDNSPGVETFMFTSLRISGIDSSEGKCSGKVFVIKAFGDEGQLDLVNYSEVMFSDPPTILRDDDYDSIEITNYGGNFVWTSGGSDGDDVIEIDNSNLTQTAFTLDLVSIAPTITRTPLATANSVKTITVETYDPEGLSGRTLTSSQVGLTISPYDFLPISDTQTETLFTNCDFDSCIPYFVFQEWLDQIPQADVDFLNAGNIESGAPLLDRQEIGATASIRFDYIPDLGTSAPWKLSVMFLGSENTIYGSVLGFNGSSGVFIPEGDGGSEAIVFSVDNALVSNTVIDLLTPYSDQVTRMIPIRDLFSIWSYTEQLYTE